ncbi:MAG: hypothetical protein DHS80DRAFT_32255 [Piptocephalis tieghemiana]|nr:MAG: hypothetical protein DHS80DRAFT_32255 [Piptocephalis tieghemiana]
MSSYVPLGIIRRAGPKLGPLTRLTPSILRPGWSARLALRPPTSLSTPFPLTPSPLTRALNTFPGGYPGPPRPPSLWKPILAVTTVSVVGLILLPPLLTTLVIAGLGFAGYRFLKGVSGTPRRTDLSSRGTPFQDPRIVQTLWDSLFNASSFSSPSSHTQSLLYDQAVDQVKRSSWDLGGRAQGGEGVDGDLLHFSPPHSIASDSRMIREHGRLRESSTMTLHFDLEGPHDSGTIIAQGEILGEGVEPLLQGLRIQWHSDGLIQDISLTPKGPSGPTSSPSSSHSSSQGHVFQGEFRPADPPSSSSSREP